MQACRNQQPRRLAAWGAILLTLAAGAYGQGAAGREVRLNEIQVIGTHNSYHAGLAPSVEQWLKAHQPDTALTLDYRHASLDKQLSAGIRQLEIDIYPDTHGGRFAHPKVNERLAAAGLPADPPWDSPETLSRPGFKVLHIQDVDYRSNCQPFVSCLRIIRDWSKAHPRHAPIFILIETKTDEPLAGGGTNTDPEPFTPALFDALDAEIRSVFPADAIITPDQVRGRYATLQAAVHAGNWPTVRAARGKVLFLMDQQRMGPLYLDGHPGLRGRILFTNAHPGDPDAAFIEQNEDDVAAINALVREGYLVRARTDWETRQARANDTSRRDALLGSGAQLLSTDYPVSEPASWTHYRVGFPDNLAARCNPLIAPPGCSSRELDPYPPSY
jgi:hypothetical protein